MKRLLLTLIILTAAIGLVSCQSKEGILRISDAYMAFDEAGDYPTKAFQPTDIFYCITTVRDTPEEGAALKAIWYAVSAKGIEKNSVIDQVELTTKDAIVPFILKNDNLWPTGSYKVEIYLNGVLDRTIKFKVK